MASGIHAGADRAAIIKHGVDASEGVFTLDEGGEAFEDVLAATNAAEPIVGQGDSESACGSICGQAQRNGGGRCGDFYRSSQEGSEIVVATGRARHQR